MPRAEFGHRQLGADGSGAPPGPYLDGGGRLETDGPVHIEKQLGVPPAMLLGPFAVVGGLQLFPLILSGLPLKDVLLHTSASVTLGLLAAFLALVWLVTRTRGELNADSQGINVKIRNKHYFYNWADIEHIDEVKNGVKISLKGRSADQNQYNIVSARFASSPGELCQLLAGAQMHYGGGPRIGLMTIAPGDNLRRARIRSAIYALVIFTAPMLAIFCVVLIWQASDCLKSLDLQKRGQRTDAMVTRIYTDGCGRSGCSIDAEFSYVSARDGLRHTGRGYLASDRNRDDPDLAYARSYGKVPVVYDPARPRVVQMNFNDRVFRNDPVRVLVTMMAIIGAIFGFVIIILASALLPTLVRALRTPK
jgi:hypothetical protein